MITVWSAVRDLGRLREISTVLVRHGFGELVACIGLGRTRKERPPGSKESELPPGAAPEIAAEEATVGEKERQTIPVATRLRLVLQDLGPSFIKLGQIASTRGDILPADIIAELKRLQDDVPPVAFEEIQRVVEESLHARLEDVFVQFDEVPLATASIGQVHRAVLRADGVDEPVVLKVQRPRVASTIARDVEILHVIAAAIERTIPETRVYSPVGLVHQFDKSITAELDFLAEAENAERFRRNFKDVPHVAFPRVFRHASSKQVLCMEYFDGFKVERALAEGFDGPLIAKKSVGLIIKMIYEDGFFHADPHPGNIILMGTRESPIVGLIDLGMVGRLSPELRDRTVDLMIAAIRRDPVGLADALYAIGRPTQKIDMREYRAEVASLSEKYLGRSMKEIEVAALFRDLVTGAVKFHIEVPTEFMMVAKTLMTIEGIGKQLDPDLDVLEEAKPYFVRLLRQRYSPERLGNELWRGMEQLSRAGIDVPLQLRDVLDDLRLGRLTVRTSDALAPQTIDRLGRRILTGMVFAALALSGGLLIAAGRAPKLGPALLFGALAVWVAHMLSDWRRGRLGREK